MTSPTSFPNFSTNESLLPPDDWIDEEILATIDEDLDDDPEFQAWLEGEPAIGSGTWLSDSVWVPLSPQDLTQARKLAQAHPDPNFAEHIRQNTLAAKALTTYIESHGIAIDPAATYHNQAILQLLNPTADVFLPNLGRVEALLVATAEDPSTQKPDLAQTSVEIAFDPGTLAYVLVTFAKGGAWLHGVMLSHDLRQDWPEGGTVPLAMLKPLSALWEAYGRWKKYQQVIAQCSEQQDWSAELQAEVITMLNFVHDYPEEHQQAMVLTRFLTEKTEETVEFATFHADATQEETVDWLDIVTDWLDELKQWDVD